MKHIAGTIIAFASFSIFAQVNITGTVTEAIHGSPVAGVVVTLKSGAVSTDTTDAKGQYQLTSATAVKSPQAPINLSAAAMICGNVLHVTVSDAAPLSIEVFNAHGIKCATLFHNSSPVKGDYTVGLASGGLAEGMYLIRVSQGSKQTILRTTVLSEGVSTVGIAPERAGAGLAKKSDTPINDTLVFVKGGFKTNEVPITAYTGSNNVVLLDSAASQSIVSVTISADYSAGNMGQYDILKGTSNANLLTIYSDNDVRVFNGSLYVLERYGDDNVLKITGSVISNSTVAYEKNIGASVNIQDIACIDTSKAYITQYGSAQIVIFNPSTGMKSSKTIDLSAFDSYAGTDSADVVPYMGRELYYNGKVYVACQRLKAPAGGYNIQAADTSKIVVINATTDTVEKAVNLTYKNPQEMSIFDGKLYVGSVGIWGVNDAGIEEIDLATDMNIGPVIDESAFAGDIGSIIVVSDAKGYAVISTPAFTTELHSFNPLMKTVGPKIAGVDAPCSGHLAFDGTYVYIGDRSNTNPGIVVIDALTDAKIGATKNIGLPPNSLALLETTD